VKNHRGLLVYDVLASGRRLQVRLGNTLTPISERSARLYNSKTTASNEKQTPNNITKSNYV